MCQSEIMLEELVERVSFSYSRQAYVRRLRGITIAIYR